MRQMRWLEYLKNFDFNIQYHPGKGNAVADALSRKPMASLSCLILGEMQLLEQFASLDLNIEQRSDQVLVANLRAQPDIFVEIREQQANDPFLI